MILYGLPKGHPLRGSFGRSPTQPAKQPERTVRTYNTAAGKVTEISHGCWTIRTTEPKRQLSPALAAKLELLKETDEQRRAREASCRRLGLPLTSTRAEVNNTLIARLKKLNEPARSKSAPVRQSLDAMIAMQLRAQPKSHHRTLQKAYRHWVLGNSLYHDCKLKLPIIVLDVLPGTMATCTAKCDPTTITLSKRHALHQWSDDVLESIVLHEQVHQLLSENGLDDSPDSIEKGGHTEAFAKVCNRIGALRGWGAVSADIREGGKAARFWPAHIHD